MSKKSKTVKFIGTPTGDGESFCWEVDPENFKKVTGNEPDEFDYIGGKYVKGEHKFIGGKLMLYPGIIFSEHYVEDDVTYIKKIQKKCKIKISYEEIE